MREEPYYNQGTGVVVSHFFLQPTWEERRTGLLALRYFPDEEMDTTVRKTA